MRRTPRVTTYNAQKLRKEIRGLTDKQLDDPQWWMYLGPDWDHWTLSELNQLLGSLKE